MTYQKSETMVEDVHHQLLPLSDRFLMKHDVSVGKKRRDGLVEFDQLNFSTLRGHVIEGGLSGVDPTPCLDDMLSQRSFCREYSV